MKYIDADRLKAEIEKGTPNNLQLLVYRDIILSLIDSLQQEPQEEPDKGLEEEITRYGKDEMPVVLESDLNDIAHHFYELGKNSK